MIKAESLTRTYGSKVAVDNVSFQIEHGEIVGLLGHNGAGKTTIMKMLTGYLEPTSGQASINGVDITSDRLRVQKSTGYLPENCPTYPDMKVLDYLDYVASLRGVADDKKVERIIYAIDKTRLRDVAKQQVNTLSRGYRQRLGVAQAILNSPQILILDEPTNGLDPSQIQEMRGLIRELAQNATVVVSTHILQEVQAVCGRVIIINRGKLALDASMGELRTSDRLLVSLDLDAEKTRECLSKIESVNVVESQRVGDRIQHTLKVDSGNAVEIAPDVTRALVAAGANVYSLQPVIQDLETVFARISASGTDAPDASETSAPSSSTPEDASGMDAPDAGGTDAPSSPTPSGESGTAAPSETRAPGTDVPREEVSKDE